MSKLVKFESALFLLSFSITAASEFYSVFPKCVAPESFEALAWFFGGMTIFLMFILIITLAEGK